MLLPELQRLTTMDMPDLTVLTESLGLLPSQFACMYVGR